MKKINTDKELALVLEALMSDEGKKILAEEIDMSILRDLVPDLTDEEIRERIKNNIPRINKDENFSN